MAPALLGVIGSAAIFRTVVDSAIKAAAGGTAAEIGKTAGAGLVKGAHCRYGWYGIKQTCRWIYGSSRSFP